MNRIIGCVKSFLFHLRWLLMSPHEKYAYLWAKTKKSRELDYSIRDVAVSTSK